MSLIKSASASKTARHCFRSACRAVVWSVVGACLVLGSGPLDWAHDHDTLAVAPVGDALCNLDHVEAGGPRSSGLLQRDADEPGHSQLTGSPRAHRHGCAVCHSASTHRVALERSVPARGGNADGSQRLARRAPEAFADQQIALPLRRGPPVAL